MPKIPKGVYDVLKYLSLVGLPALATFISQIGPEWDIPKVGSIVATIVAFNTLLGALVIINQVQYNNSDERFDGTIDPAYADAQTSDNALNFGGSAEKVSEQKEVLLKVNPPRAP